MCYSQLSKKCIVWLIIISVLFVYIEPPAKVYAEPVTLATAWGGTIIAKEVLALVVALAGAGVTIATQSDAWEMYNDLKNNNQSLLNQIISVQPQVWTGAYNEVVQDLQDIKTGIVTWLTGIFGTLVQGENSFQDEYIYYNNNAFRLVKTENATYVELNGVVMDWAPIASGVYEAKIIGVVWMDETSTKWVYKIYFKYKYSETTDDWVTSSVDLTFNKSTFNGVIEQTPSKTISISADAPALNPEWNPDEDRRYLPPPWIGSFGKYPEEKVKDIPTATGGTQKVYDGDIEEYLEDITNNATWSEIDEYIKIGANTTTLTPTAEGTLEVGEVITDGLPYPDIVTDSPVGVLEGFGAIGGLLQGLINWLSRIYNAILAIPEAIASLFIPETNPFSANLTEINNNVNQRIGNPAAGYVNLFQPIQAIPIPDLIYKDNVILHASFVNDSAETIRNWQRYLWTVILILLGLNNIYKLIRGTDLITIKGQHGKGWSSSGN